MKWFRELFHLEVKDSQGSHTELRKAEEELAHTEHQLREIEPEIQEAHRIASALKRYREENHFGEMIFGDLRKRRAAQDG